MREDKMIHHENINLLRCVDYTSSNYDNSQQIQSSAENVVPLPRRHLLEGLPPNQSSICSSHQNQLEKGGWDHSLCYDGL